MSKEEFYNSTLFEYVSVYKAYFGEEEKVYMELDELEKLKKKYPDKPKGNK